MERFLVRLDGGPLDGETRVAEGLDWPLPGVLGYGPEGQYVKIAESRLPPQDERSHVARGAAYRWEETLLSDGRGSR